MPDIDFTPLAEAVQGKITQDGNGRYTLTWPEGSTFVFRLVDDVLDIEYLQALQPGRATLLAEKVPPFARKAGIRSAVAHRSASELAILKIGYEVDERLNLLTHSYAEPSRNEQYAAWKRGTAAEPEWHRRLTALAFVA